MVGNDLVDLRDPETRPAALHARFDERAFAAAERERLRGSPAPDRLRWILWAAKEAAYKLARKLDGETPFAPARWVVNLDEALRGSVVHEHFEVRVAVREERDAVHAIALDDGAREGGILAGLAPLADAREASDAARRLAADAVSRRLGIPRSALRFERRHRIPFLHVAGVDAPLDLSLSHHGSWVAFACDPGELFS